jgi:Rrf2 family iron-sulfur cluster assembly transcriptional regulator
VILNQTAVYALRAMAALAGLAPGESIRAVELAERTLVPVHYLSKVMRRLVVAGLVIGRKGHGGGFSLARPPRSITLADVLAATDVTTDTGQCAFGWGDCDPDDPCSLHPAWSHLQEVLDDWAGGTTLEQTCNSGRSAIDRRRSKR